MRTTQTLLAALALFGASTTALAEDAQVEAPAAAEVDVNARLPDTGADPVHDPYTNNRGLTQTPMAFFRELTVDPATFPATLKPTGKAAAPAVTAVKPAVAGSGQGLTIRLAADAANLPMVDALNAAGHKATQAKGYVEVVVGEAGLIALLDLRVDGKRVTDMAIAQYEKPGEVVGAPEPTDTPDELAPEAPSTWEAYEVFSAKPGKGGGSKTLVLENTRSSWASVKVNGTKIGIVGPYTTAYIHGVKGGTYDLSYTFSNGYELVTTGSTVDQPDAPRAPGVTPFGKAGPGL